MVAAIVLFAIAAAGGLLLASLRLKNRPLPMPLALVHGAVAAAGLIALIIGLTSGGAPTQARIALVLFVIAALGGAGLFSFHLRKKPLPVGLMAVHGLVAAVAFLVLLVGVIQAG